MSGEFPKHPFLLSVEDTAKALGVDPDKGLSSQQVQEAHQKYPENEFEVGGSVAWYTILSKQVFNAMVLVLIFAMILSFAINDYIEGGVLAFVIVANVTIGFWQEYRAEKQMDSLRALSAPSANVLRDGKTQVIPNAEVVPGDIILLKMGDTVPADLRMFETMNLSCDEQSLTGEAQPVDKISEANITVPGSENLATSEGEVGIGDRLNIAYATTIVRKGRGRGIVIATGMQTEVGKIAASTQKKTRRPGRSMNYKKYGKRQPVVGLSKRIYDAVGKFLGLTEGTPLQKKLAALAYILFGCAIILAIIVFAAHRFDISGEVIIYAVSLGIAIIPESLVAVLTITMVVAVTVMRKANVVVRDLSALEALGGVTNICSDKTGTLTQGAMIVRKAWLPFSHTYTVRDSQNPSDPTMGRVTYSEFKEDNEKVEEAPKRDYDQERSAAVLKFDVPDEKLQNKTPAKEPEPENEAEMTPRLKAFLLSSALCNLATVRYDDDEAKWQTTGEPTEIALQVFSHRFKLGKKFLEGQGWRQLAEFPFDSSIKRMSVVYDVPESDEFADVWGSDKSLVFTKGAVERILDLCTHIGFGEDKQTLTEELKEDVIKQMNTLASQGQRVLAVGYRDWDGKFTTKQADVSQEKEDALRGEVEQGLTLLGLAGIYDPPRRETKGSITECSSAGISVHMLTGDHPETAKAIAKEVGIIPKNLGVLPDDFAKSIVMKATDFDKMTDAEIDALPELPLVIARCAPDTKTRMIEALRRRNAFMAMTGDGVNDAPSLSRADVGIAMGSGSDVAKSASKIVLTDDKFDSIVAAIRQGRRMFDNIQKFILHLLSSNVGEVILLCCGLAFRDQSDLSVFPISPLEILWINMVTSSFPAFGLGREEAASDVMRKPPQDKKRGVFSIQVMVDMIVYGIIMGTLTLVTFVIIVYGANGGNLGVECNKTWSEECRPVFRARAAVFAELTWIILISAWEFKNLRRSMFRLNADDPSKFPLFKDLYANKFLFWAVIIGALSVFPVVYIPTLNTTLFKHTGISWEWGIVVGFTILYVFGVETWKFIKRTFNLLDDHKMQPKLFNQGGNDEGRDFKKSITFSSFKSWHSFGRKDTGESTGRRSRSQHRTNTNLSGETRTGEGSPNNVNEKV
ncbi:Calcium-transporting ATPase 3-like protein 1 [Colletotrichum chlorophyti]|uniref:P-type Na(+) transporter n=1 Tax=Colletotrichum chlorophyti TaxID=708187 RepID=A0A1Q8RWJ1_9PEZI|nr:Calcium-transporting ATPase 3-like protein 1 [Colletotrichum chlorophyti]